MQGKEQGVSIYTNSTLSMASFAHFPAEFYHLLPTALQEIKLKIMEY